MNNPYTIEELEWLHTQGIQFDERCSNIPRTLARLKGERVYYLGHPCGMGHVTNRDTKTGTCQGCKAAARRRYRERRKAGAATP
jgi:hypothetical protein